MKWKLLGHLLGAIFLIGLLIFAAYMLIPFVRYLSVPVASQTAAPVFQEDPSVVKMKAANRARYFEQNVLGNASEVVSSIDEVPIENGWINTAPLDLHQLAKEGHLILVHFWRYADVGSYDATPYMRALWSTYHMYGLVIVSVHTPLYTFEKNPAHILNAIHAQSITFPVVTDGDHAIELKFGRHPLPSDYLINSKGEIVFMQSGESDQHALELGIRKQLEKEGWELPPLMNTKGQLQSFPDKAQTPTLNLGSLFIRRRLGNDTQPELNNTQTYEYPKVLATDRVYLQGQFKTFPEYLQATEQGEVTLTYLANTVYPVLGQAIYPLLVEVTLNDAPIPQSLQGKDIIVKNGRTYLSVVAPGMYFPIKSDAPYGRYTLKMLVPKTLQLYAFEFGVYH